MFIRANSGGTLLGKSDLLFSLLISAWDEADQEIDDLLARLNAKGYGFTRDFVMKTCLTLLDKGAKYEVEKFRQSAIRQLIEDKWDFIAAALLDVQDFLYGKTFVKCDKALPSYLGLIPVVYFRYHFPDLWKGVKDLPRYLVRILLTGAFSALPDQVIDTCVARIKEDSGFQTDHLFDAIRGKGRNLELSSERLLGMGYGSDTVHLLFNLWYDFDYTPAYQNNLPQVDHIFPQSLLKSVKVVNPDTKRHVLKYRDDARNQLANCMLLTAEENGPGGKSDTPPAVWFAGKPDEYLERHLIPKNPELWEVQNFENFVEARKRLILSRFAWLLPRSTSGG